MNGSGLLHRLVLRGLMLVAALVAICAFHSVSEPTAVPAMAFTSVAFLDSVASVPVADATDVRASVDVDSHGSAPPRSPAEDLAHLTVVGSLGLSLSILVWMLAAAAALRAVAPRWGNGHSARARFIVLHSPSATAVALTQLRISRT